MGFLLLLFTTLFALQFAEARVLQHNSVHLDAVAVASSTPEGHLTNYKGSESNHSSNSVNKVAEELFLKEATPGVASVSKAPEGIKEVAPMEGNVEILHEMRNSENSPGVGHMSVNILSSSRNSPGVGHWQKYKTKYSSCRGRTTAPNNVLSSGSSPGVGNAHTSGIAGSQSELGAFNKLPSGPSPGVGHKVINGNTELAQELESKKSAMIMNKLPSCPSSGVGHSATDGRNLMEKISMGSESMKKTELTQEESDSKRKSAIIMNILPSVPSPGVGNSAANVGNTMEKSNTLFRNGAI